MSKNLKLLLVAFTTSRVVDGEERRVRFPSKSVVDLSAEEQETLDALTKATGKLHYRDPIQEGGKAVESKPTVVEVPDYAGQDVPVGSKTVDQLKAYLTFHSVDFDADDKKPELVKLAEAHEAELAKGGDNDQDGGL